MYRSRLRRSGSGGAHEAVAHWLPTVVVLLPPPTMDAAATCRLGNARPKTRPDPSPVMQAFLYFFYFYLY
ncbi:hypothetical protein SORBI_3006G007650 [Sorghum bicolor]|uniref:Uncharacterized protein n=1 Tax=Sorghum bicolor TaxID=4558 RepID=A0A1Z5RBC8_SORBI|nr:hypothetical protein SORBI_3006G007650 [Sorghum bicolor]